MNEHSSGTRAEVPPSATDRGTWISVDDRLPEIDDIVIGFWNPSAGVIPSCYGITKYAGYWCNPDDSDVAYGVPSHWMPLPNPPANWKKRPLLQETDTGTDSTRSGDQIKPDGVPAPDQGSVRNATDEQDAKRYRWLKPRYHTIDFGYGDTSIIAFAIPEGSRWSGDLDASIDAAIHALPVLEAAKD